MSERGYRVGLITPGFPPRVGGVEAHVGQLAGGLVELGCEVCVFTQVRRDDPTGQSTSVEDRIEVRRFRDITQSDHFEFAPTLLQAVKRMGSEFDVIHAHGFHGAPALVAALFTSVPFVFTPHYHGVGHTPLAKVAHVAYDRIAEVIFRRAVSVICVSEAEARMLAGRYPLVASRTVIIPNGVNRAAIEAAAPFACAHQVVLAAGRLEAYKQVDRVIDAMTHLPDGLRLVVVGDGPVRTSLERMAREEERGRPGSLRRPSR